MPRFDGTGPRGAGPMTGRGEGYCVLELPESSRPARGYVGLQGTPVRLDSPAVRPTIRPPAVLRPYPVFRFGMCWGARPGWQLYRWQRNRRDYWSYGSRDVFADNLMEHNGREVMNMPRLDGTGPAGMGPMTGGGRGWCNPYGIRPAAYGPYRPPYAVPANPAYGYGLGLARRGLGRGFGRGRGRGPGRGW